MENLPNFIIDGVCKKDESVSCNIGYACDACPYNKKSEVKYASVKIQKKCYCCKKVKEGNVIFVTLGIRGTGENKVTETEIRFVCHSCNHLKPSMDAEPDHITLGEK